LSQERHVAKSPLQLELLDHSYRGEIIRQRARDGFINATAMCKAAGREYSRYREMKATNEFLKALSLDLGLSEVQLTQRVGGTPGGDPRNQGMWVHPQIAIDLAQWLSPEFKVRVTKWIFDWMSGHGSPMGGRRGYVPDFVDRFHLNQKQVPPGYFSVLSELFVVAYALLEREGYVLPRRGAQGQNVSPDVSVGKLFASWLRDNYPRLANLHVMYTHVFMDGRRVDGCRAYPNSMLGIFRDYVINIWMRDHAPRYLGTVDPPSIEYLEKVIASLPPPEAYPPLPPA